MKIEYRRTYKVILVICSKRFIKIVFVMIFFFYIVIFHTIEKIIAGVPWCLERCCKTRCIKFKKCFIGCWDVFFETDEILEEYEENISKAIKKTSRKLRCCCCLRRKKQPLKKKKTLLRK